MRCGQRQRNGHSKRHERSGHLRRDTYYTIGGTVSGLTGATGLSLANEGGNYLTLYSNGEFEFSGAVASGTAYNVTVYRQLSYPAQTCTVTNGSGTATANVTNIQVACGAECGLWNGRGKSASSGTADEPSNWLCSHRLK